MKDKRRISPDTRLIAVLVYLTACLQVIGYAFKALQGQSMLARYLTLHANFPVAYVGLTNQVYVGLMIAALVLTFFRWSPWPFYVIGFLFLVEAALRTVVGTSFDSSLTLLADCSHYLWFLAVGYALRNARTLDVEIGLPSVRLLLRLGLALTFVTHGVEAILRHPGFVDNVLLNTQRVWPLAMSPLGVSNVLMIIGAVDVVVGLLVLFKPNRTALVYMALWGALTAFSRMFVSPSSGLLEALIRAPHYMLPFLILFLEGQRSIRKPIRHVTLKTLNKMGLSSQAGHWAWKRSSHEG